MSGIDAVRLNFSPATLHLLNAILGIVMFGVALDLKSEDFRRVLERPRPVLIGLAGHYVVFPAVTFLLVLAIKPPPSVALDAGVPSCSEKLPVSAPTELRCWPSLPK